MINKPNIDGYDLPEDMSVVFDTEKEEIVDVAKLSPLEILKLAAQKAKPPINIKDPDPDCDVCYGRGYKGHDAIAKHPVPCECLFTKEDLKKSKNHIANNRHNREVLAKLNVAMINQPKKNLVRSMGLNQIDKNLYKNKNGKMFTWDGSNFVKKV